MDFIKNRRFINYMFELIDSTVSPPARVTAPTNLKFWLKKDTGVWVDITSTLTITNSGKGSFRADFASGDMNADSIAILVESDNADDWKDHKYTKKFSNKNLSDIIESRYGEHTFNGNLFYVAPINGLDNIAAGADGSEQFPFDGVNGLLASTLVVDSNHDMCILLADDISNPTILDELIDLGTFRYFFVRGPGRDLEIAPTVQGDAVTMQADGQSISGVEITTHSVGNGNGINVSGADFVEVCRVWITNTRKHGISFSNSSNGIIHHNHLQNTGLTAGGDGINIDSSGGPSNSNRIIENDIEEIAGVGVRVEDGSPDHTDIIGNFVHDCDDEGVKIGPDPTKTLIANNVIGDNGGDDILDGAAEGETLQANNEQWATSVQALRLLGLNKENQFIDTTIFNSNNQLLTGRLRTYSVKASVGSDSDVSDTYNITVTYKLSPNDKQMETFQMVRV